MFMTSDSPIGVPMSIDSAPADTSPDAAPAVPAVVSQFGRAARGGAAALLLASAAQLITISVLVVAHPIAAVWSSLLLAVAPALLTAGAVRLWREQSNAREKV
jgi:hypothetical protein